MNSFDPWRVMQSSPPGEFMVVPPPYYGSPLFGEFCEEGASTFLGADPRARATDGFSAHVELDPKQVLHAVICVDGKTYEGSLDLTPALHAVLRSLAQFHTDLHATMPAQGTTVSGDLVVAAVDRAVGAAADELVGALVHRHYRVAGWWDSLTHGLKAVVDKAGDTIKALKGPIHGCRRGGHRDRRSRSCSVRESDHGSVGRRCRR